MSSFINKSGKKVAPKGAPRRRAGGPPTATPAAPQSSVQPVVDKDQETLQSSDIPVPDTTQAQLPTPSATQGEEPPTPSNPEVSASTQPIIPPDVRSDPAPSRQLSSTQQPRSHVPSQEINAQQEPIVVITPELPKAVAETTTVNVPSSTRRRSASPFGTENETQVAKRRRVEEVVDVSVASGTAVKPARASSRSPKISRHTSPLPETRRAPVAVMLPGSVGLPVSKPSVPRNRESREPEGLLGEEHFVPRAIPVAISTHLATDISADGSPVIRTSPRPYQPAPPNAEQLASHEIPSAESSQAGQSSSRSRSSRAAQSAQIAGGLTPSDKSTDPKTKGARKDQWKVSTPTDINTGKGKRKSRKQVDRMHLEPQQEIEIGDELGQPSVVTLTPAVHDASVKPRKARKDKGVKRTSKTSLTEGAADSAELPDGEANGRAAGSEPQATEPATEVQKDPPTISEAAQKRLANAQKRKAKQLAKHAALSKATGRANAAIIDNAVAQSIEGRGSSSSRAKSGPTFIVAPGASDRGSTVGTGRASVAATEITDGGTILNRKKRQKRAETPEENETVFIVESKTNMFDLAGRDTENRVGFKSEREKAMRLIDWDEVKAKRKAENERMARMARGKRNQEEDYDPEEEGMDEDQRLARAVARNKHKRPGLQITLMANGEHVIDEQSQMVDRQRLNEDELELLEEVEEDDLTKKFNVQTYGLWRRKEEEERIPHNERWTFDQTEKFYDALTSFGTDFMIISTMFPGMTRRQIKAKFVREERAEPERIRDALTGHNSGRRNGVEGSGWDLKVYCEGAGLSESSFLDPKKIHEELERERLEKEKEIEEARAEAAEEDRQRRLAGALNGDDELGSDGEPLSPEAVVQRAREEARRKKLARLGEKKRRILEMAGGSEEVVESIEDG
ncbi:hypothetical protein FKW77_003182 [Venturia effusa]|uniref:Transcription factor TFIIIB component B'' Myb domain-containing protein n=1 Tax=Venturia effusa TaxID=50376 RepID=A0A517LAM9_9PEZI|nr:hypothetical protein FKW77_003182 [Venturia effusa]